MSDSCASVAIVDSALLLLLFPECVLTEQELMETDLYVSWPTLDDVNASRYH